MQQIKKFFLSKPFTSIKDQTINIQSTQRSQRLQLNFKVKQNGQRYQICGKFYVPKQSDGQLVMKYKLAQTSNFQNLNFVLGFSCTKKQIQVHQSTNSAFPADQTTIVRIQLYLHIRNLLIKIMFPQSQSKTRQPKYLKIVCREDNYITKDKSFVIENFVKEAKLQCMLYSLNKNYFYGPVIVNTQNPQVCLRKIDLQKRSHSVLLVLDKGRLHLVQYLYVGPKRLVAIKSTGGQPSLQIQEMCVQLVQKILNQQDVQKRNVLRRLKLSLTLQLGRSLAEQLSLNLGGSWGGKAQSRLRPQLQLIQDLKNKMKFD